jgi:hypothetical protein
MVAKKGCLCRSVFSFDCLLGRRRRCLGGLVEWDIITGTEGVLFKLSTAWGEGSEGRNPEDRAP